MIRHWQTVAGRSAGPPGTIVLDADGTLDTDYHHAMAWHRAFRDDGVVLPLWWLHRHMGMGMGMGGDQLIAAVARTERECGDPSAPGRQRATAS